MCRKYKEKIVFVVLLLITSVFSQALAISFHEAIYKGDLKTAKTLIEQGRNVNTRNEIFETPLYQAAEKGDVEIVKLLIANEADVNADCGLDGTALHIAVYRGHTDIAKLLIAHGANVNTRTGKGGWTPLHLAVDNGDKELIELLIANGADLYTKDMYHKTVLDHARGSEEIVELLIAKGAGKNYIHWIMMLVGTFCLLTAVGIGLKILNKVEK